MNVEVEGSGEVTTMLSGCRVKEAWTEEQK